jgi:hypothetical protein
MEALASADGTPLAGLDLAEQESYWQRAKAEEKVSRPLNLQGTSE